MQCSTAKMPSYNGNSRFLDAASSIPSGVTEMYNENNVLSSDDSVSRSSSDTALANNQLVLITNNFCTNFPLIKPIEEDHLRERSLAEMGYDKNMITDWKKIVQPEKEDLKTLIIDIIMKHDKTDVEIKIDETTFRCHMIVLQCYSKYFDNIADNPKTIYLPSTEITPKAFYMIYKWMLSSDPAIARKEILNFLKAAEFLQIECAVSQCWACICDHNFIEDTAFLLYSEAREIGLIDVKNAMSSRICRFFLNLVASKDFLELNVDEVVTFINSNSIGVHTEMEVFFTALRWLFGDWEERSKYSLKLIHCVRFGHMTQSQLLLLKRNKETEIAETVDDTVIKMIDEGISLHIMKMNTTSEAFLNEPDWIEPAERQWLLEEKVEKWFNYSDNASYKTFLEYLRYMRDVDPFYWQKFQEIQTDSKLFEHPKQQTDLKDNLKEVFGKDKKTEISYRTESQTQTHRTESQTQAYRTESQTQVEEPCKDTKILFRSKNYHASESTVSSTTSKSSKILRYNCPIDRPLKIHSSRKSIVSSSSSSSSSISIRCLRKKLPFSEFQLYVNGVTSACLIFLLFRLCQHLPNKATKSSLTFKSSLNAHPCDTMLIFGGVNPYPGVEDLPNSDGRQVYQYIPSKNRWNWVSLIPNARQYHSVLIFQGRIYVAGGVIVSRLKKVTTSSMVSFDPVTLSWFKEKDMPVKIKNFGFVATHLQMYTIGGEDNNDTPINLVFRYDPVNTTWNEEEAMNFERSGAAVAIHKNFIWVAGGCTKAGITDSVEYFDPISGIWTEARNSLRVPRGFARMCSINGKLFIVGGINENCSLGSVDVWDEMYGIWKQTEEMETPRHGHEICIINTCIIIVGGINSNNGEFVSKVECYCQNKMAWTDELQPIPVPMVGMAGLILPSCYVISLKS